MKIKLDKKISIWFTGYPASGKTTLALKLKKIFDKNNIPSIVLDGDMIRKIIFNDTNYDKKSRINSSYKYLELAKILLNTKIILIVSTNHHTNIQRTIIRKGLKNKYLEIWMNTPLKICKSRDPKKLYSKFSKGKIFNLVGGDLKFEKPLNSDLILNNTKKKMKHEKQVLDLLIKQKVISYG